MTIPLREYDIQTQLIWRANNSLEVWYNYLEKVNREDLDGLNVASSTTIFDVKQWKSARVYATAHSSQLTIAFHACTFHQTWRPMQRVNTPFYIPYTEKAKKRVLLKGWGRCYVRGINRLESFSRIRSCRACSKRLELKPTHCNGSFQNHPNSFRDSQYMVFPQNLYRISTSDRACNIVQSINVWAYFLNVMLQNCFRKCNKPRLDHQVFNQ